MSDARVLRHISFFVPGPPAAQGSMKKVGEHVMHNSPQKLMYWRNLVFGKAVDAMAALEYERFEGPVAVVAQFAFERPKSVKEAKRPYPIVPPDLDKLVRAIGDALNGVVVKDDAQIVEWKAEKAYAPAPWADIPGVRIIVREV